MNEIAKNKLIDVYYSFNGEANSYTKSLFINNHKICLQGRFGVEFYEVNDYDINDESLFTVLLTRIHSSPNEIYLIGLKYDFNVHLENTLFIRCLDPTCLICLDNECQSVKRINFLTATCDNTFASNETKIERLLVTIDEDYILVEMKYLFGQI